MKMLILFAVFLSQVALADTYSYQLYYDQEKTELLDIKMEITLSGKFNASSKVLNVKIVGLEKGKEILLFDIPAKYLKAVWSNGQELNLSMKKTLKPLIKEEYIPIHSDTWIKEDEDFDFSDLILNEEGSLADDEEGFYLANQTVEEMSLSGFFKKM